MDRVLMNFSFKPIFRRVLSLAMVLSIIGQNLAWAVGPFIPSYEPIENSLDRRYGPIHAQDQEILIQAPGDVYLDSFFTKLNLRIETPGYVFFEKPGMVGGKLESKGHEVIILDALQANGGISFESSKTRNSGTIYTKGVLDFKGKFKNTTTGAVHAKSFSNLKQILIHNKGTIETEDDIKLANLERFTLTGTLQTQGLLNLQGQSVNLKGTLKAYGGAILNLQSFTNEGTFNVYGNGLSGTLTHFINYGLMDLAQMNGEIAHTSNGQKAVLRTHTHFDLKGQTFDNTGKVFTCGIHRLDLQTSFVDRGTFYAPSLFLLNAPRVAFVGQQRSFVKDVVVTSPLITVEKGVTFSVPTQDKYIFQMLSSDEINFSGHMTQTTQTPFPYRAFFDLLNEQQTINLEQEIRRLPLTQWNLSKAPLKTGILLSALNNLKLEGATLNQDGGSLALLSDGKVSTQNATLRSGYFKGNNASIEGQSIRMERSSLASMFGSTLIMGTQDISLMKTLVQGGTRTLVEAPQMNIIQSEIRQNHSSKTGAARIGGNQILLQQSQLFSTTQVTVLGQDQTRIEDSTLRSTKNIVTSQKMLSIQDSKLAGNENLLTGESIALQDTHIEGTTKIEGGNSLKIVDLTSTAPIQAEAQHIDFEGNVNGHSLYVFGIHIQNKADLWVQKDLQLKAQDIDQLNKISAENIAIKARGAYRDTPHTQNRALKTLTLNAPNTPGFKGFFEADHLKVLLHHMDLQDFLTQTRARQTQLQLPYTDVVLGDNFTIDRNLHLSVRNFANHKHLSVWGDLNLLVQGLFLNKGHMNIWGQGHLQSDIMENLSGTVEADTLSIHARQLLSKRLVERTYNAGGYKDLLKDPALFKARAGTLKVSTTEILEGIGAWFYGQTGLNLTSSGTLALQAQVLEEDGTRVLKKSSHHHHSKTHDLAKVLSPAGPVYIDSGTHTKIQGLTVQAFEQIHVGSQGFLSVENIHDTDAEENQTRKKGRGFKSSKKRITQEFKSTPTPNQFYTNGSVDLISQGNTSIQTPDIQTLSPITIKAAGHLSLPSDKFIHSFSKQTRKKSAFWQSQKISGCVHEQLLFANLQTPQTIIVSSTHGITLDIPRTTPLLPWMEALKNQSNVQWVPVDEVHKTWNKKVQGLTPASTALVALAVSIATSGLGDVLIAGMGGLASSMMTAGAQMGLQQITISLINNQGALDKAIKPLGSSKSLYSLGTAIASTGLTFGLYDALGVSQTGLGFTDHLQRSAVQTGVSTGLTMTYSNQNFEKALLQGLVNVAGSASAGYGANQIGDLNLDPLSSGLLHFALGAGLGGASNLDNPLQGALGGGIGAGVAETLVEFLPLSFDRRLSLDLSRMGGAMAAFMARQDVNAAVLTATNAVENNFAVHHGLYRYMTEEEMVRDAESWREIIEHTLDFLSTPIPPLKNFQTRQLAITDKNFMDTNWSFFMDKAYRTPSYTHRAILAQQMNAQLEYMGNMQLSFPTTIGHVILYISGETGRFLKTISSAVIALKPWTKELVWHYKMSKLAPKVSPKKPIPFVTDLGKKKWHGSEVNYGDVRTLGKYKNSIVYEGRTYQTGVDLVLSDGERLMTPLWNQFSKGPYVLSAHGSNAGVWVAKFANRSGFSDETKMITALLKDFDPTFLKLKKPFKALRIGTVAVNHRRLAKLIQHDPKYEKGRLVVLDACMGGGRTLPQNLANKLGTPVLAPTDRIGFNLISEEIKVYKGRFKLYYPLHKADLQIPTPNFKPLGSLSKKGISGPIISHPAPHVFLKAANANKARFVKNLDKGRYEAAEIKYSHVRTSGLAEGTVLKGDKRFSAMFDWALTDLVHGISSWQKVEKGSYVFIGHSHPAGGVLLSKLTVKKPSKNLTPQGIQTTPTTFKIKSVAVDHRSLAKFIKQDPRFKKGNEFVLLSCKGGGLNFPQHLSNALGSPVIAPSKLLWPAGEGDLLIASSMPSKVGQHIPDLLNMGELKVYYPGITKSPYPATQKFQHTHLSYPKTLAPTKTSLDTSYYIGLGGIEKHVPGLTHFQAYVDVFKNNHVHIELASIRGTNVNVRRMIHHLQNIAKSHGAKTMEIGGDYLNDKLKILFQNHFGLVTHPTLGTMPNGYGKMAFKWSDTKSKWITIHPRFE